jgi:glycerate 2-kinase
LLKILTKDQLIANLTGEELKKREQILKIAEQVLNEINPEKLVREKLRDFDVAKFENIYVVGSGKGTAAMAEAVESVFGDRITKGVITIPEGTSHNLAQIKVIEATHPLPNEAGVQGSRQILELAEKAGERDLVIALISGGGSALLPLPVNGVSLKEKIEVTSLLLKSGATIQEMNRVRKHLSQIKGGWLAKAVYPAQCLHLVISDVLGDDLGTIASGPLAPDESTFADAIEVLQKYKIWNVVPETIRAYFEAAEKETPNPGDEAFERIETAILANHETPAKVVSKLVPGCEILTTNLNGEAREQAAAVLARASEPGVLYVATGETTVTIRGDGKGGRNQEFMLALAREGFNGVALSIGTDGVDGICPEPTAGAIISARTLASGVAIDEYLDNNDSYHFFKKTGDLIQTGPSGTNLGDLVMILR